MRGSPINNLRPTNENISPLRRGTIRRGSQRGEPYDGSPQRLSSQLNETQYWKLRARKYENEVLTLNQEIMFLNRKLQKMDELEQRIELLIGQNTHLVQENEDLLKVVHQKHSQIQAWRLKFDSEYHTTNALQSEARRAFDSFNIRSEEHRIEVDRLTSEISRLHDQLQELQKLKSLEVEGIKSKFENETLNQIQNLKRSQQGNNEIYEIKIQKLKEQLDAKHFELETARKESKLQYERLNSEISFLKNDIKKVQQQKEYEIELLKAENENNIKNLTRTHKKNEEEMKGLYENKIRRLGYDLQEKKGEVEETLARVKRTGKEGEVEIARLVEQKDKLRQEMKQEALRLHQDMTEQAKIYETQLVNERQVANSKELNIKNLFESEIDKLRRVIEGKQKEIESIISQSRLLKQGDDQRIDAVKELNTQLRDKISEMVLHYQREIELLKIKVSRLYEADIQALTNILKHQLEQLNNENDKLKRTLTDTKDRLVNEIEDKLLMRRDYQNRLNEMNLKFEAEHKQLNDLIMLHEKNYDNARSQTSIREIEHGSKLKRHNTSVGVMINEKRNLQNQIKNKNKEIEELNLRIQKMELYHKKDIDALNARLSEQQARYKKWLDDQAKVSKQAADDAEALRQEKRALQKKLKDERQAADKKLADKNLELEDKRKKIAQLQGQVEELRRQHGSLDSKLKVQVGNIEKTNLEMTAMMNNEKERLEKIRETDKEAIRQDFSSRIKNKDREIEELNQLIENIRRSYQEQKLRCRNLEAELAKTLASVDERSKLEEHVINIGLSNNYFKNIAEVFKKRLN